MNMQEVDKSVVMKIKFYNVPVYKSGLITFSLENRF